MWIKNSLFSFRVSFHKNPLYSLEIEKRKFAFDFWRICFFFSIFPTLTKGHK